MIEASVRGWPVVQAVVGKTGFAGVLICLHDLDRDIERLGERKRGDAARLDQTSSAAPARVAVVWWSH